ncbi:MAG TPA: ATP-binding protein, partial [Candidatus Blautia excrementipullorum]|nr:ATP-binding protein [Candidatus Blautia excrementipullorum]
EYDVPLDKAFQAGYYNEMISLIRNLLGNALKTNDSLYFSVLTGCLRISKESIFTGLNNLKVHTISDLRYDEYFGFTNADVDEILKFYGLTSYKDVIQGWYDGYRFGNTDVYCPWDVINYCDELLADPHAEPENYWANTSGNDLIRRLLKKANQSMKNDVEQLINGGTVIKPIRQELTYREAEDSISVRDTAVRRNMKENFYHGMLLGLLRSQDSWLVKSNAETGEGYSDISIQTPDRVGMIIELKYADDGNLEAACREALSQIEEKKYAEGPSGFLFILAAKPG